jgi:MarR family 2-MHQ and catechol resistance regulon transcriptional repressor
MVDEQYRASQCPTQTSRTLSPPVRTWLAMAHLVQRTERMLSALLRCHDVNPGQLDVLVRAGEIEGLTQQELAERLCHSKANVSQLLDKLERAELLRRVPDGRAYRIHLTDAGRALVARVMPDHERLVAEQFAALAPDERQQLFDLMDRLETESD